MQHRHVVLDHRGFSDHQARRVIKKNAAPDAGGGMDVALKHRRRAALQVKRESLAALVPEPVRQPLVLDGMEAFVIQHRFDQASGRRIAVDDRRDIGAEAFADRGLILYRFLMKACRIISLDSAG